MYVSLHLCIFVRCIVRTYVYMYVCMHVCTYASMCVCMNVCMHACVYVRMHERMHVSMHVCCACTYVSAVAAKVVVYGKRHSLEAFRDVRLRLAQCLHIEHNKCKQACSVCHDHNLE